jgi:bifunctional non-homologous end joining protein LigD
MRSDRNFDALIIGYYERGKLFYAGRTRNGFTPPLRVELIKRLRRLRTETCPFANLPEMRTGDENWPLGPGPNRRQDEGMPLAEASAGWAV